MVALSIPEGQGQTTAGAPILEDLPSGVFGYSHFKLNHGLSGPDSAGIHDPDGDGISNFLEFAYGLDPLTADASSEKLSIGNVASGRLELTFRRRDDAPHLSYLVESSTDLQTWAPYMPANTPSRIERISYSVKKNISIIDTATVDPHFFNLKVVLNDSAINTVTTIDSQADFDTFKTSTFLPGDLILLKRGQIFSGMFAPLGSGTATRPIRIASYGEGPMPIINALGVNKAAVHLKNVQYWEVHNLEVTNTNGSNLHQGKIMGIYVETDNARPASVMNHLHIKGCYVHDVNGRTLDSDPDEAKRHGGIQVNTYGTSIGRTRIHDLQIVGNTVEKTGGIGIELDSDFNSVQTGSISFLWTSVYVAQNYVNDTDRNNMIIRDSLNPLVEYNVLANSSRENTGHSLFNFHTVGLTAQHNEAYGNIGSGSDRGGYDADYNAQDTTYQYNYSHDNMWAFGIMKKWNKRVDIRYNISQNDRSGFVFYGFDADTECEDVRIYNNVYFNNPAFAGAQFVAGNRKPHNTKFYNNLFNFSSGGFYGSGMNSMVNTEFSHNAYRGIPARLADTNAVTLDPMLMNPRSGGTNVDMTDPNRLLGYRLKPGSPLINAGKSSGTGYVFGARDFWGNPVPAGSGIDIGVHEFQPTE